MLVLLPTCLRRMRAVCSGTGLDWMEEGKGKAAGLALQAPITLLTSHLEDLGFFP